jgi:hypothetical protein
MMLRFESWLDLERFHRFIEFRFATKVVVVFQILYKL